jgi:hypothetical protein
MVITRDKQIKGLTREKKINIINNVNPGWEELFDNLSTIKTGNENFFNSLVFIPIRSLASARDDTILRTHGGEGKSGEPIEMAGTFVIITRLAALSLPVTSRKPLSSRALARDLNIL